MSIQKMFRRPEKYNQSGGSNPATPTEKAAAVWDRRVGSAVTQAYNWRRATILMGVACLVLAGGLVVQSLKTQVIPYVVTVDKSTGEVEKAGAFTGADYTPGEAETLHSPLLPDNLYVADATILPQSLGLPPILTIMALAKRIAKTIMQ